MTAADRARFRDELAEVIGRIAGAGGTPLDAVQVFGEALRDKVSESLHAAALAALEDLPLLFTTSRRARGRRR